MEGQSEKQAGEVTQEQVKEEVREREPVKTYRGYKYLAVFCIGLLIVLGGGSGFWVLKKNQQVDDLTHDKTLLTAQKDQLLKKVTSLNTEVLGRDRDIKGLKVQLKELGDLKGEIERKFELKDQEAREYKTSVHEKEMAIDALETRIREIRVSFQTQLGERNQQIGNLTDEKQELLEIREMAVRDLSELLDRLKEK
jgi:chromosome segregation ATPase